MYTAMVVDDEYPARNMLDLLINWEESGFQIIAKAENGKQALEIYRREKPDLVITDVQMPVMDGIELIEEIRRENEQQCIVVLSCHESFFYAQQVMRLGVKDYLIKDMLTEEQLRNCLSSIREKLEKEKRAAVEEEKFIFEREADVNIRQNYPAWINRAENRMDFLQNSLREKNYEDAQRCIEKLYQIPFEGLVRYHYLDWVNKCVCQLLQNQCEEYGISVKNVLGKYENRVEALLLDAEQEDAGCQVLCEFIKNLEQQNIAPKKYSVRIQHIIHYVQENYYCDISLQSVAEQFGVHKVYLARKFKEETGETLNEFLNKVRIEKAKLLLTVADNKANEIAYTVGYNNTQSFYSAFKKYVGCSPKEYRKGIANM